MFRCLLILALCLLVVPPTRAGQHFASVSFHDVVDFPGDLDEEAMTVDRLIGFFEWLRVNRWATISLDDVEAARLGSQPLPERAILITFDDGYRSVYTRVFPLLLAYRIPVVVSLVGVWMDAPMEAKVRYGDSDVPRARFLHWEEAREMARSGLVEFASHSYDLHRAVQGNPQGNELPAAYARRYTPGRGYESAAEFRERIADDFAKSRALLTERLGRAPRALVWPYGRYTGATVEAEASIESSPSGEAANQCQQDIDRNRVVATQRNNDVGVALARFDEFQVHRLDRAEVLLDHG